jgi:hypothetical protein
MNVRNRSTCLHDNSGIYSTIMLHDIEFCEGNDLLGEIPVEFGSVLS